jgi:hypothetical protein
MILKKVLVNAFSSAQSNPVIAQSVGADFQNSTTTSQKTSFLTPIQSKMMHSSIR